LDIGEVREVCNTLSDSMVDVIVTAKSLGIPLVGMCDDSRLKELQDRHKVGGPEPLREDEYSTVLYQADVERLQDMTARVSQSLGQRSRTGPALVLANYAHLQTHAFEENGVGILGVGEGLRTRGFTGVDVFVCGGVSNIDDVIPNLSHALSEQHRSSMALWPAGKMAILHLPETPVPQELIDIAIMTNDPEDPSLRELARIENQATRAFLTGRYLQRRREYFPVNSSAAEAFRRGAAAGDRYQHLDEAREHFATGDRDRGFAALDRAIVSRVPGAERIAAAYHGYLGVATSATHYGDLANVYEQNNQAMWRSSPGLADPGHRL
jgi:hypothetical protein